MERIFKNADEFFSQENEDLSLCNCPKNEEDKHLLLQLCKRVLSTSRVSVDYDDLLDCYIKRISTWHIYPQEKELIKRNRDKNRTSIEIVILDPEEKCSYMISLRISPYKGCNDKLYISKYYYE